ncbi:MAG: radical SAM protein [Fidelibacterota bacterium]|nr:MAG: radical SAM protein [Candidatus Neomarinimicrobiota bacterium]
MALTHWQLGDRRVMVSHKEEAITVSLKEEELVSYDLAGRFLGSYDHGTNIRRGLDNTFQQRWRIKTDEGDRLCQRTLPDPEARAHLEGLRNQVSQLPDDKAAARAYSTTAEALRRAAAYTYDRLAESARTFTSLYGHIPILPPDQYRALVVQATDGCTYNQCTFCTLYRDKSFQVRSPEDFRRHIQQVLDFMEAGLSYRNSLFLGDANATAIATTKLVQLMDILRGTEALKPIINQGGVHAFLDTYTGTGKSSQDYRTLKDKGLRRVSLGVESGSEGLLALVRKPGTRQDIHDVVSALKEAGVAVVIIFMVGLGGHRYREEHLAESASLVRMLPLSRGDIIYLSQFTPGQQAPYLSIAKQSGVRLMTAEEIDDETHRWKTVLGGAIGQSGVKVAPYSFQRFIY